MLAYSVQDLQSQFTTMDNQTRKFGHVFMGLIALSICIALADSAAVVEILNKLALDTGTNHGPMNEFNSTATQALDTVVDGGEHALDQVLINGTLSSKHAQPFQMQTFNGTGKQEFESKIVQEIDMQGGRILNVFDKLQGQSGSEPIPQQPFQLTAG